MMIKKILIFVSFLLTFQSYGQTPIQTREIKIPYSDGYIELFNVCISGCQTTFDDTKEYFWYTEFSNIKSTKGGSGGSLLHGNYKLYDKNGSLLKDKNYFLGLQDGSAKTWDSTGNITELYKYSKGDMVYWKFKNDKGLWIEWNCLGVKRSSFMSKGWVKKAFSENMMLLSEETFLAFDSAHVKSYFNNGKLAQEYTSHGFMDGGIKTGKYTSYYENGKIAAEGQFYDGETDSNIQIGTWKYYNSDGTLKHTLQFKENIELWDNGNRKVVGGFVCDSVNNPWLKQGVWLWYDENGKLQTKKKYLMGDEDNQ
jgi:antitoxin component YwqK of YwqJK toxin-antitoxin module